MAGGAANRAVPFRVPFRAPCRAVVRRLRSSPVSLPVRQLTVGDQEQQQRGDGPVHHTAHKHATVEAQRASAGRVQFGVRPTVDGVHVLVEHAQRQHGHRRVKEVVRGYKEDIVDGLKQGGGRADGHRALLPMAGDAEEPPVGPRGTGHSSCSVRRDTTHLRAEPAAAVRSVTPSGGGKLSGL